MHPYLHAQTWPDKAALIMAGSGETVTYRQLDERSNQGAHLFRSLGLNSGDAVALLMDNCPRFLEVAWAAQRSGLYYTPLSSKLSAGEAEYILRDCGAKAMVASAGLGHVTAELAARLPDLKLLMVDGVQSSYRSFERARDGQPTTPIADQSAGADMLYSSGTTGRPKGVKNAIVVGGPIEAPSSLTQRAQASYGVSADSVYLSTAPLYHAAPLRWCMAVQRTGGTVVVMEKFDAEAALRLIESYRVDVSQWVPTHFVRLLKLDETLREKYDISSLRAAIHAAAPCPVPVKQAMIDWWGPVLYEYYAGTEGNGMTAISSSEWLAKKGSVGKAVMGEVKICGDDGEPLPRGQEGGVYFSGGGQFKYHNDPVKTAESCNQHGWTTLGDVGYLDGDGYLFLTDRKAFMIISGGVNIYPQEIENLLITHPKVADVAVIGAPDEDMGEKVVAVVQPIDGSDAGEALAAEIIAFARSHLSHVKTPRVVDFMTELPRHATGKLYKRLIRDAYWGKNSSNVA
jgi:long-chain acyl-CoA synthetase